jgi:GNAT superfamily N-acetyltransferase
MHNSNFSISTDNSKLDLAMIHNFLKSSYWAEDIPIGVVDKSIANSFCFGVYEDEKQVGFARVITDYITFAYLADVFILEAYRGQGLGKLLVQSILEHPELRGLRKWLLATKDAHELYRQYGFQNLAIPELYMEISNPNIYKR